MLVSILNDVRKQINNSLKYKKHPFRYFTLTTIALDGSPHSRTVVLRGFDPKYFIFSVYTDSRSEKINELKEDQRAEFLFYDSNQLLQLAIKAKLTESVASNDKFEELLEPTKKDYSSIQKPGSILKGHEEVEFNFNKGYFIELKFKATQVEYLKLKRPKHIRAMFYANKAWQGNFLVP